MNYGAVNGAQPELLRLFDLLPEEAGIKEIAATLSINNWSLTLLSVM